MKYLIIFEEKYIKHKNQMYLLSERQKTYFKKKKKIVINFNDTNYYNKLVCLNKKD